MLLSMLPVLTSDLPLPWPCRTFCLSVHLAGPSSASVFLQAMGAASLEGYRDLSEESMAQASAVAAPAATHSKGKGSPGTAAREREREKSSRGLPGKKEKKTPRLLDSEGGLVKPHPLVAESLCLCGEVE